MREFLATLRRRPAPLIGTFVALAMAALLVTATTIFIGTGVTSSAPAQRLAGTTVVVTGNLDVRVTSGAGDNVQTQVLPLPDYRRVPSGLASRLAAVDGVAASVPDVSFPVALESANGNVATGTAAEPFQAHGWASAALTPFRLTSGHPPVTASQIVLGSGVAASTRLRVGSAVRLAGQDLPPFTVVGVAAAKGANPAGDWTVFVSDAEAAALYGHPGQADLIGIVARPGVSAATLTGRVQAALGGSNLTVLGPAKTGQAEDLAIGTDKLALLQLATNAAIAVGAIAFFVVAGTIALSIALRWRNLALLRAVGATPGQVRRMIWLELAVLGAVAGLAAYLPGLWLANWALRGLAAHQLLPPSPHAWTSVWVVVIAAGAGIVFAEIAAWCRCGGSAASARPPRSPRRPSNRGSSTRCACCWACALSAAAPRCAS